MKFAHIRLVRSSLVKICIAALIIGHAFWLPILGNFLIVADPLQPADAIVPLGGGDGERVQHCIKLFKDGHAKFFIALNPGFHPHDIRLPYSEWIKDQAMNANIPDKQIITVGGAVSTTYHEAMIIHHLAQVEKYRSIIIVTDPYHTRRTRMIFQDRFKNTNITISVQPTPNYPYHPNTWWKHSDMIYETVTEYVKMVSYFMGYLER